MSNFFKNREKIWNDRIQELKGQLPPGYIIVPITPTTEMLKASSLSIGSAQTEYYRMIGVYPPFSGGTK